MLHIITRAYRFDLLKPMFDSLPKVDDIHWHISKSKHREDIVYDFLKSPNITIYNVDCLDTDRTTKTNHVFDHIKDGYFCLLDDDTIFHENMYIKYLECTEHNFRGMLVGEQLDFKGNRRLPASVPIYCRIDTGNVLSHHSCLPECEWPKEHIPRVNQKDFLFWDSVYNYYGRKCAIWNQPISIYNKLK